MSELAEKLRHLETLHRKKIDLSLDRWRLLKKLGSPQLRVPPVIHVAGTNGKGSTIAMMRAMLEAAGLRVHAYTSPHLLRFNERIRLAGELADDATLIDVLNEVEAANGGDPITFFEITTATAFLLFSRVPADVLLLEVGMGGRLDSTNVLDPAITVITRISMDHMEFLGDTIQKIAGEKAGIMKRAVPCVAGYQADEAVRQVFRDKAKELVSPLYEYGRDFSAEELPGGFIYETKNIKQEFPLPALLGAHQIQNAATAITAVKLFSNQITDENIRAGLRNAEWPGRLEHITQGSIAALMPDRFELWYDGAHNDSGAEALAEQCRRWQGQGYEIHLIVGMLSTKSPAVFAPVMGQAKTITAITFPGEMPAPAYSASALAGYLQSRTEKTVYAAETVAKAIHHIIPAIWPAGPQIVLVAGSLHLAEILA